MSSVLNGYDDIKTMPVVVAYKSGMRAMYVEWEGVPLVVLTQLQLEAMNQAGTMGRYTGIRQLTKLARDWARHIAINCTNSD